MANTEQQIKEVLEGLEKYRNLIDKECKEGKDTKKYLKYYVTKKFIEFMKEEMEKGNIPGIHKVEELFVKACHAYIVASDDYETIQTGIKNGTLFRKEGTEHESYFKFTGFSHDYLQDKDSKGVKFVKSKALSGGVDLGFFKVRESRLSQLLTGLKNVAPINNYRAQPH